MKILLVDDHALFRDGLRYVLQQLPEAVEVVEAGNFPDALKLAKRYPELDLALLDLNLPGGEGVASVKYFHWRYPHIPVVVVSGEEDRAVMEQAMDGGAAGFVCKNSPASVMLGAMNLVLSGGVYVPPQMSPSARRSVEKKRSAANRRSLNTNEYGLTGRQVEVLGCIASGMSNREIAEHMNLAEGTVKIHIALAYQVLRVGSRVEAVRAAERLGLVSAN